MDPLILLFVLAIVLPSVAVTVATTLGVSTYRKRQKLLYSTARRDLSNRLIEMDARLSEAELHELDAPRPATQRARAHLNAAFRAYSDQFASEDYRGANRRQATLAVETELNKSTLMLEQGDQALAVEQLTVAGKEFGREVATLAKIATSRLLEAGTTEIRRMVAEPEKIGSGLTTNRQISG